MNASGDQIRRGPKIGAELPTANRAVGGLLNSHGQFRPGLPLTRDDQPELVIGTKSKLPLESPDGGDAATKVHASNIAPKRGDATLFVDIPKTTQVAESLGVSKWWK